MSWSVGRRLLIGAIVVAVLALIIGWIVFLIVHKAPSCVDGKQNQNEEGIDCGGICTYLCTAKLIPPVVSFVREFPQSGRTDVVAYIKNPNTSAAAKAVPYTIELYNSNHAIVAKKQGTVDLAPGIDAVVFIPNFFSGSETIDRAFLSLDTDASSWFRYQKPLAIPLIAEAKIVGSTEAPRVSSRVTNPFATTLRNIKLIATVFDDAGNAIAASQTLIPELAPQGSIDAIFTWNAAFAGQVSRIDVKPIAPLPSP